MRRWEATGSPLDLEQELLLADQAHLRLVMVSSLDGASSIDGRVGALTGPADQRLLTTLREVSDVVLVGAGTVRAEGYGPLTAPPDVRAQRAARGQSADPGLAIVTGRGELDLEHPLFTEAATRPVVVTVADCPRLAQIGRVADVVLAGEHELDLGLALAGLRQRGLRRISCEGGAGLNGSLLAGRHVDELVLSFSPLLVGGDVPGILGGPALSPPRPATLTGVYGEDGALFTRWSLG